MKRISELHPLSHDHHHALVLANRCKKVAESGDVAACTHLWHEVTLEFLHTLRPHFHIEEQTFIAPLQRLGEDRLMNKLLEDHGLIQACVFNTQRPEAELLGRFGSLLANHVRFEERDLFTCAQNRFSAQEKKEILDASLDRAGL